jgi:hypothetical protein
MQPNQAVYRFPSSAQPRVRFEEVTRMQETANNPNKNREKLKNKRKVLFKLFLKNPMYTRLALEIKALDDQLADSTQHLARK